MSTRKLSSTKNSNVELHLKIKEKQTDNVSNSYVSRGEHGHISGKMWNQIFIIKLLFLISVLNAM